MEDDLETEISDKTNVVGDDSVHYPVVNNGVNVDAKDKEDEEREEISDVDDGEEGNYNNNVDVDAEEEEER